MPLFLGKNYLFCLEIASICPVNMGFLLET